MKTTYKHIIYLSIICVFTILAYSNSMHAPFVFDCHTGIVENKLLHVDRPSLSLFMDVFRGPYKRRPLVNLSFAFNHMMGGMDVFGYHVFNVFIHLLSAVGLYFFALLTLRLAVKDIAEKRRREISFFTALLWCIHPINTQAVTYILQRMASLAGMFMVWGLVFYLLGRSRRSEGRNKGSKFKVHPALSPIPSPERAGFHRKSGVQGSKLKAHNPKSKAQSHTQPPRFAPSPVPRFAGSPILYIISLLLFLLALGSKETAIIFPFILLMFDYIFFNRRDRIWWCYWGACIMVTLIAGYLFSKSAGGMTGIAGNFMAERMGGMGFSGIQRLMTEFRVLVMYLSQMFFPHPSRLNLDHDVSISSGMFYPTTTFMSFIILSGLICLSIYLLYRGKKIYGFCILWWFLGLALESSVISLELMYEHRLYLPNMGVMMCLTYLFFETLGRYKQYRLRWMVWIIVIMFGVWTYQRNSVWGSEYTLWQDVIKKSPYKARPHNNLGNRYYENGDTAKAEGEYRKAIRLEPEYSEAHFNLGKIYKEMGDYDNAKREMETALILKPDVADIYAGLADVNKVLGDYKEAERLYIKALSINPFHAGGLNNLGNLMFGRGRLDEAKKYYTRAIQLYPKNSETHNNLGSVYFQKGMIEDALAEYSTAIRLEPRCPDTLFNLGNVYRAMGDVTRAIKIFEEVIKLDPNRADAYHNLGLVYKEDGRYEEAVELFLKCIKLKPGMAEAHYHLGGIYFHKKEFNKALDYYRKFLLLWQGKAKYRDIVTERIKEIRGMGTGSP